MNAPAPRDVLWPGALVGGKYRVEALLGRGGMGEVYLAVHEQLGRRVAIKAQNEEAAADPGLRARFRREAMAASRLASEHIAEVSDVGELPNGVPYMVMEYLQGRDLAEHLRERGTLGVSECLDLLTQLCRGLAVAHAAGIVHRDLKPANLFLVPKADGRLHLKILDFGIAKSPLERGPYDTLVHRLPGTPVSETPLTAFGSMLGSARYMAPEQMESAKDVDARADIWSVGIIAYKMLSGRFPYEGASPEALYFAMRAAPPTSINAVRPGLPPPLIHLVEGCLRANRDERWPSVDHLVGALSAAAPTPSFFPPPPPLIPPTPPRPPAQTLLLVTGIVAALVLALGGGALYVRGRETTPASAASPLTTTLGGGTHTRGDFDLPAEPMDLLPRAIQEARKLGYEDPKLGYVSLSYLGAPTDPRNAMITFGLAERGKADMAQISFGSTFIAGQSERLEKVPSLSSVPACGYRRAREVAVAHGFDPLSRATVMYGLTARNAWYFHRRGPDDLTIDGATCAVR